jgi:hypothetical protein
MMRSFEPAEVDAMLRKSLPAILILLASGIASAQTRDVLIIQSGSGPSGGPVSIPMSIGDLGGTPLGSDAGAGNRIQGFAFKITFPTEVVASVSFARAAVTTTVTPMFETEPQGTGFASVVISFRESSDPIPFTLNAPFPGNQIGTLTVSLQPSLPVGTTALLTIDPPSAILSNQAGTVRETVASGGLSLQNGSVTVSASAPLATPAGLVAAALSASQVNVNWQVVANANHYEIWRSIGGAFVVAGTSSGAAFADTNVVAHATYVYRVRAVSSEGGASAFSNFDPATTSFTDDPLVMSSTLVKVVHVTELRSAVNSLRLVAGLQPLAADPTLAAGMLVRKQHIDDLRTALNQARSALGLSALTFTDPTLTAGTTPVKAAHVQQLRDGVK